MSETTAGLAFSRQDFLRQYKLAMAATVLVPMALAWALGFLFDEEFAYFFGVTLLSFAPPIFGVHDLFFDIVEWIEARRRAEAERLRHVAILAADADSFRQTIARLNHDELWHLSRSIVDRRPGFILEKNDPALAALIDAGLVTPATQFRADGYPFFIPDRPWVLMCALADEVLQLRDRKGPRANDLDDGHIPEELPLLFPDRYRRREPLTWRRTGKLVLRGAERVALGVAAAGYQFGFATVFWGVVIAALLLMVIVLVSAGWAIGVLTTWLFG